MAKKLFFSLITIMLMSCGSSYSFKGKSVSFTSVGYYKSNGVRILTFAIETSANYNSLNPENELMEAIKKHGEKQMNTKGHPTYSFYFQNIAPPDVTAYKSTQAALDKCYESNPIALVNIDHSGKIAVVKRPGDKE